MTESVFEFVRRRREELLSQQTALKECIAAASDELCAVEVELTVLDRLDRKNQARSEKPKQRRSRNWGLAAGSIPSLAMKYLVLEPHGLRTDEILARVQIDRPETVRTSLSPQLSRLRDKGDLVRREDRWVFSGWNSRPPEESQVSSVSKDYARSPEPPYSEKVGRE